MGDGLANRISSGEEVHGRGFIHVSIEEGVMDVVEKGLVGGDEEKFDDLGDLWVLGVEIGGNDWFVGFDA